MGDADGLSPVERGRLIAELRAAAGLTQREVGERIGIQNTTISLWERGRVTPKPDRLVELDRLYKADGEVLALYQAEGIGVSRIRLLEAEIQLLRATVEESDDRLSQVEGQVQPTSPLTVPTLTATQVTKLFGIDRHELKRLTAAAPQRPVEHRYDRASRPLRGCGRCSSSAGLGTTTRRGHPSVRHLPGPLSPRNRGRVPELSTSYRGHGVHYEPGPHTSRVRTRAGSAQPGPHTDWDRLADHRKTTKSLAGVCVL